MSYVPLALACIALPPFLCPLLSSPWDCFISGNPGTFGAPCFLECGSFVSRPFTTRRLSIPFAASAPSSHLSSSSCVSCWRPSWLVPKQRRRPSLCRYARLIQQTNWRRDFYRLDFLRPWRRGYLSHPPRLARQGHSLRVPGYPWTPLIFVLAAAAIVGNAIFLAFRDPDQFHNLIAAIVIMLLGLPAYFFWRKRASS